MMRRTLLTVEAGGYTITEKICGVALAVVAIIFSLAVFHGDTTLMDDATRRYVAIPNYLAILVLTIEIIAKQRNFNFFLPLFLVWLFEWWVNTFHLAPRVEVSLDLGALVLILLFCFMNNRIYLYGFRIYRLFLVFCSILGIIAFVGFLTGFLSPLRTVEYYNTQANSAMYFVYPLSYLMVSIDGVRLCGLFNEPGYFGTMLALTLIADGFDRKAIGTWIMLLAGVFTFSVAFFLLILIYFAIKSIRGGRIIVYLLAAIVLAFVIVPSIPEDSLIGTQIVSRITYDKDTGKLAGDSRTTDNFETYWRKSAQDGKLLFGQGAGYFNNKQVGSLSYRKRIVEHGYVFCFLIWGTLFFICARKAKKSLAVWCLIICFFASIYQRPSIFLYSYMLILFGGIKNLEFLHNRTSQKVLL